MVEPPQKYAVPAKWRARGGSVVTLIASLCSPLSGAGRTRCVRTIGTFIHFAFGLQRGILAGSRYGCQADLCHAVPLCGTTIRIKGSSRNFDAASRFLGWSPQPHAARGNTRKHAGNNELRQKRPKRVKKNGYIPYSGTGLHKCEDTGTRLLIHRSRGLAKFATENRFAANDVCAATQSLRNP